MDIRIVETLATTGGLSDSTFRVDSNIENISLDWDEAEGKISVVDYNLNYNILPWQLQTDLVKKVFLTYNGKNCEREQLIETVVLESADSDDINQIPGYNNSNEWSFTPSTFTYPSEILSLTNPSDFTNSPYDWKQGFTVVKQFLTSAGTISPYSSNNGNPAYTAYFRAPQLTSIIPANVEGNTIYTDGWYTSYVCLVRTWSSVNPISNGVSSGDILYFEPTQQFYMNVTGVAGSLTLQTGSNTLQPDIDNWEKDPNFEDWQTLMRNNLGSVMVDDPIYFTEHQHLVTVDLNKAILNELKRNCGDCCGTPEYGLSHIATYIKLIEKRLGAWVQFNNELFHESANILASARPMCSLCLYHNNDCLPTPRPYRT
jgi:hypothetical protein